MNNGAKKEKTLELERDTPSPYKALFDPIINIQAIETTTKKSLGMSKGMNLSESMPELEQIARDEGLSLSKDWTEIMRIFNMQNLNK